MMAIARIVRGRWPLPSVKAWPAFLIFSRMLAWSLPRPNGTHGRFSHLANTPGIGGGAKACHGYRRRTTMRYAIIPQQYEKCGLVTDRYARNDHAA